MTPDPVARPGHQRRPEAGTDAAFVLDLFRAEHGGPLAGLGPALAEVPMRQQCAGQAMSYRAAFPAARFEIVEVDGQPVGRVVTDGADGALRLVDIVLLPEWRGRGIGTRLLRALQAEARDAGLSLRLSVARTNTGACRLYARLGFAVEGEDAVSFAPVWAG